MLIRPATVEDTAAIAHIRVDTWRSTYQGIVPESRLRDMSYEKAGEAVKAFFESGRPETFSFVAEEEGAVVGFAFAGPERSGDLEYRGEIYALYVLADHQGRGTGRGLVSAVAGRLCEMGLRSMLIWALSQNPFRGFYEALGGIPVRSGSITIDGIEIEETGYGWPDISELCPR